VFCRLILFLQGVVMKNFRKFLTLLLIVFVICSQVCPMEEDPEDCCNMERCSGVHRENFIGMQEQEIKLEISNQIFDWPDFFIERTSPSNDFRFLIDKLLSTLHEASLVVAYNYIDLDEMMNAIRGGQYTSAPISLKVMLDYNACLIVFKQVFKLIRLCLIYISFQRHLPCLSDLIYEFGKHIEFIKEAIKSLKIVRTPLYASPCVDPNLEVLHEIVKFFNKFDIMLSNQYFQCVLEFIPEKFVCFVDLFIDRYLNNLFAFPSFFSIPAKHDDSLPCFVVPVPANEGHCNYNFVINPSAIDAEMKRIDMAIIEIRNLHLNIWKQKLSSDISSGSCENRKNLGFIVGEIEGIVREWFPEDLRDDKF